MVLGVNFLRTLGPILWDFDDLCMDFWHSGKRVLWKGIGSTRWDIPSTSTLHALSKDNRPAPSAVRPSRYPQLQKDELMLQQEYAKKRYDAKQRPLNFAVGDWVWLRTLHRPMQSLLLGTRGKLSPSYAGPFQVLQRVGDIAYRLQLPDGTLPTTTPSLLPLQHGRLPQAPKCVLRSQLRPGVWHILVKWTRLADADATWEPVTNSRAVFPDFQLEDELLPKGGRDVMVKRAYERRSRG